MILECGKIKACYFIDGLNLISFGRFYLLDSFQGFQFPSMCASYLNKVYNLLVVVFM